MLEVKIHYHCTELQAQCFGGRQGTGLQAGHFVWIQVGRELVDNFILYLLNMVHFSKLLPQTKSLVTVKWLTEIKICGHMCDLCIYILILHPGILSSHPPILYSSFLFHLVCTFFRPLRTV